MRPNIFIAFLALLVTACDHNHNAERRIAPVAGTDAPFVFIYAMTGLQPPNSGPGSGVVVAVWENGAMVRATSEADVGTSYVRGKLTPEQVAHVHQLLQESGILSSPTERPLVIDARAEYLAVRSNGKSRTWAHNPGFENTGNASSTDPRMTRIKHQFMALPISNPTPEPADPWAHYPHAWFQ